MASILDYINAVQHFNWGKPSLEFSQERLLDAACDRFINDLPSRSLRSEPLREPSPSSINTLFVATMQNFSLRSTMFLLAMERDKDQTLISTIARLQEYPQALYLLHQIVERFPELPLPDSENLVALSKEEQKAALLLFGADQIHQLILFLFSNHQNSLPADVELTSILKEIQEIEGRLEIIENSCKELYLKLQDSQDHSISESISLLEEELNRLKERSDFLVGKFKEINAPHNEPER